MMVLHDFQSFRPDFTKRIGQCILFCPQAAFEGTHRIKRVFHVGKTVGYGPKIFLKNTVSQSSNRRGVIP